MDTTKKILTEDRKREIAEKLLSGGISDIAIMFTENGKSDWVTTMTFAELRGSLEIVLDDLLYEIQLLRDGTGEMK